MNSKVLVQYERNNVQTCHLRMRACSVSRRLQNQSSDPFPFELPLRFLCLEPLYIETRSTVHFLLPSQRKKRKSLPRRRTHTQLPPSFDLLFRRLTIQPNHNKHQKPENNTPQSADPRPRASNGPTSRPFVVRKVPDCDLSLLFNGGQEGPFVVDFENEDTVLVGGGECRGEDGAVERAG